jgi:hypothetical protein
MADGLIAVARGPWLYSAAMGLNLVRGIAFLLAVAMSAPLLANENLLAPSPRALAAADSDEPPPHVDPATVRKAPPRPVMAADEVPVYKKWWFWAVTAAVIGGTVAFGVLTFTPIDPHPRACPATARVCFGDGRMQ